MNLNAWRIEALGAAGAPAAADDEPLPEEPGETVDAPDEDVPF